ncbi:MAG: CPBP family intramembrane glutamic endopeptidase [Bacteroidota bacterium]
MTEISFSTVWRNLLDFVKDVRPHPLPEIFEPQPLKVLPYLLGLDFLLMIPLLGVVGLTGVEEGEHELINLLDQPLVLFFMAVVLAPIFEELFFRFPIGRWWEKFGLHPADSALARWWQHHFKRIFWVFTIVFAAIHFSNFTTTVPIYLAPILVLPQLVLGVILGYIRIGWSTRYSMLFHAIHNGIPVTLLLLGGDLAT